MGFVFLVNKIVPFFVFGFLALNCFNGFGYQAQLLPEDEGNILHAFRALIMGSFSYIFLHNDSSNNRQLCIF